MGIESASRSFPWASSICTRTNTVWPTSYSSSVSSMPRLVPRSSGVLAVLGTRVFPADFARLAAAAVVAKVDLAAKPHGIQGPNLGHRLIGVGPDDPLGGMDRAGHEDQPARILGHPVFQQIDL